MISAIITIIPDIFIKVKKIPKLQQIFQSLFFDRLITDDFEPFLDQVQVHLGEINRIILDSGASMEGNIFYPDGLIPESGPNAMFRNKRRSLAMLSLMQSNILEIGFNAGHSALLMLAANDSLMLTCIDIAEHPYTLPCADYLSSVYGHRFQLRVGSSQSLLPSMDLSAFSAYHVDGSHAVSDAAEDMINIIHQANDGSIIAFDDADCENLRFMLDALILTGQITPLTSPGLLTGGDQMFFRINQLQRSKAGYHQHRV